jgi:Homeodomain-like domain
VLPLVVSLVFALCSAARSRAALHLEILALRHQLAVLNRSRPPRLRLTATDRMLWAWLSQAWSGWRPALVLVKPDTVLAWHRRGFRLFWGWKSRQRTGRPATAPDVRALIRRMAATNPLWGAPRIHGELQKLGISVSQATVAKYMPRRDKPPSQRWGERSWPITSARSWLPISLSCPQSPTGRCSCSLSSRTIGDGPRRRHRPSHGRLDGPATPQRLSRGPRAAVPAARPRYRIHGRRVHYRRDADP